MTTQHLLGFFTIFLFAARPFPAVSPRPGQCSTHHWTPPGRRGGWGARCCWPSPRVTHWVVLSNTQPSAAWSRWRGLALTGTSETGSRAATAGNTDRPLPSARTLLRGLKRYLDSACNCNLHFALNWSIRNSQRYEASIVAKHPAVKYLIFSNMQQMSEVFTNVNLIWKSIFEIYFL